MYYDLLKEIITSECLNEQLKEILGKLLNMVMDNDRIIVEK
ncbi:hypothetical protein [Fusobacterium sp. THCT1E2]